MVDEYQLAQRAMTDLKTAVLRLLVKAKDGGLTNAEIGRALGIYRGHQGHEGHVSRTVLAMLQEDGVAIQDEDTKKWSAASVLT